MPRERQGSAAGSTTTRPSSMARRGRGLGRKRKNGEKRSRRTKKAVSGIGLTEEVSGPDQISLAANRSRQVPGEIEKTADVPECQRYLESLDGTSPGRRSGIP